MNAKDNNQALDEQVRAYYAAQRLPDEHVARILAAAGHPPRRSVWYRHPQWIAAAAALVILLGGASLWHATPVYAAYRVVAEVAQTHLTAHAPQVHGDCFDRVGTALDALDFPLKPSPDAPIPEGLTVLGGRYCTVRGEPAAQILLVDAGGRRCTLIVAVSEGNRLARVRVGEYETDGVRIRIWRDGGRLFVMAV